jgi:hypothetical protein
VVARAAVTPSRAGTRSPVARDAAALGRRLKASA